MAELKLQKRYKYAGDIMPKLLDIGFDLDAASDFLNSIPDADVAPRAEVEELQAECNKWQERLKTECEYTEAITKKKVAMEIIGEILSTNTPDVDGFFTIHETELTELKKKYTEDKL